MGADVLSSSPIYMEAITIDTHRMASQESEKAEGDGNYNIGNNAIFSMLYQNPHIGQTRCFFFPFGWIGCIYNNQFLGKNEQELLLFMGTKHWLSVALF